MDNLINSYNFIRKIFYNKDVQFQDTKENKARFLKFCRMEGYQWVNYNKEFIPENPIQISRLFDDKTLVDYNNKKDYETINYDEFLKRLNNIKIGIDK